MKIRPLHKIEPGSYMSSDQKWLFTQNSESDNPENREWWAYQQMLDGGFHRDTPYFFESYPTLKSLIKALEKAKP